MKKNTNLKMFRVKQLKLYLLCCLFFGISAILNAQIALLDEVKISDKALHFNGSKVALETPNTGDNNPYDYFFGPKISVHGDCIKKYNEYVFMTWYKGPKTDRHVMLTRYNTITKTMATIEFPHRHTGYLNRWWLGESHNTIGLAISPLNGTIHMVYDMHAYSRTRPANGSLSNDYFRYSFSKKDAVSVSDEDFTLSQFVKNSNDGYKHLSLNGGVDYNNFQGLTYPKFFLNDTGDLFIYIREGGNTNGAYKFSKYTASTSKWSSFTKFNVLNAKNSSQISDNWGLYGSMNYVDGKIRIGFNVRSNNTNDKYQYQNGMYYAYSDSQDGLGGWKNYKGESISLPVRNPEIIKVFEPGDLVEATGIDKVRITDGLNWTVTDNGDVHLFGKVQDNQNNITKNIHTYKPSGTNEFITTTDFNGGASFSVNGDLYLAGFNSNGRPTLRKANGGTNNFTRVYEAQSGKRFTHGKIYIDDGKMYYFLMENAATNTSARPIYLQIIDLNLDTAPQGLSVELISPNNNSTLNAEQNVLINAKATTDNGTVTKVEFIIDGTLFKTDDDAPFNAEWTPTSTGLHTIEAIGYSSTNEIESSGVINVNVETKDYTDLRGDVYRLKNVATGAYAKSNGSGGLLADTAGNDSNSEWEFLAAPNGNGKYNIESKGNRGLLRYAGGSAGNMIVTSSKGATNDSDKIWTVIYHDTDKNYSFQGNNSLRYLYHTQGADRVTHAEYTEAGNLDDNSKWIVESKTGLSVDDDKLMSQSINVYPNPTDSDFTIVLNGFNDVSIVFYDLLGKVVHKTTSTSDTIEIKNNGKFTPGIYFIKVSGDNNRVYNNKLIIK